MSMLEELDIDLTWYTGTHMVGVRTWEDGVGFIQPWNEPFVYENLPPDGKWVINFAGGIPQLDSSGLAILGDYPITIATLSDPGWNINVPAYAGHITMHTVPEPSCALLLGTALVLMAMLRRWLS